MDLTMNGRADAPRGRRVGALARLLLAAAMLGASVAAHAGTINILPIRVCDNAGANCGNSAGTLYLAETNKIWAQAGIVFNYLPFASINNSVFTSLDSDAEISNLFFFGPGAPANPLTIAMYFVNSIVDAYGVAQLGGNRAAISNLVFAQGRLDTIAHEVGHLLGLRHEDPGVGPTYLMAAGADANGNALRITPSTIGDITPDGAGLDKLTPEQIRTALADAKVIAVPLPASAALLASGLVLVALRARRRGQAQH